MFLARFKAFLLFDEKIEMEIPGQKGRRSQIHRLPILDFCSLSGNFLIWVALYTTLSRVI